MALADFDFYNAQVDVLNAVARVVLKQSPLPVPDRLYTSVGEVAHDCDQITVSASAAPILRGGPGGALDQIDSRFPVAHGFVFRIELVRCWPAMVDGARAPSPATIEEFSYKVNTEGWVVYVGLQAEMRAGTLFPESVSWCRKFRVTSLTPLDPSGGVAGWMIGAAADVA